MSTKNNYAWVKGAAPILWGVFFFGFKLGPWGSLLAMTIALVVIMALVAVSR